ncbi:MAG: YceI family protein [bacterium]|nr:YceI family protein [bacterium]
MKATTTLIFGLCLMAGSLWAAEEEEGHEIYRILQKGYIEVAGKTNFFDFKGEATRQEGELLEEHGLYTGRLTLRFKDLKFDLPMVEDVLNKPGYMDATTYPTIVVDLDHFKPAEQPKKVVGEIEMHGVKRPLEISTHFQYIPPVVKVTGQFTIQQSEFDVKPYRAGLMKVKDDLEVKFKVFFCETYTENKDNKISAQTAAKLLAEDNITVLMEQGFFGCAEIKNKQLRTP